MTTINCSSQRILSPPSPTNVVNIDVRLRFHSGCWSPRLSLPTFDADHNSVHSLISAVESFVAKSAFFSNQSLSPSQRISSICIPAIADTPPTQGMYGSDCEPSSDSDSDNELSRTDKQGDSNINKRPEFKGAYFSADHIQICVDDNVADKDVSRVPYALARLRTHLYHARPSEWIPRVPRRLNEMVSAHALPNEQDVGLWETIHHEESHKQTILTYAALRRAFTEQLRKDNMITANGVVLLHGPPGTGKTTLCRAVAHRVALRAITRGVFLHVQMEQLTSMWFGQSAQKVAQLFRGVRRIANRSGVVFVLLDEVESVAMRRHLSTPVSSNGAVGSSVADPGDAMRAVNMMLTGIDTLRVFPNVIILATSNLVAGIDEAFIDRADLVLKVDVPAIPVIRHIISQIVCDISRKGLVNMEDEERLDATCLEQICTDIVGLSARRICKLALLALAAVGGVEVAPVSLSTLMTEMARISQQWSELKNCY